MSQDNPARQALRKKLANYPIGGTGRRFSTDTAAIMAEVDAYADGLVREAKNTGKAEAAQYFKKYMVSTSPFISQILDPYLEEHQNKATQQPKDRQPNDKREG